MEPSHVCSCLTDLYQLVGDKLRRFQVWTSESVLKCVGSIFKFFVHHEAGKEWGAKKMSVFLFWKLLF